MRKKILATILVAGLLAAQTLTAFAQGSDSTGTKTDEGYVITEDSVFSDDAEKDINVLVKDAPQAVKDAVKDTTALTDIFDLDKLPDTQPNSNGEYVVTFTVPNLNANCTSVSVLHYVNGAWEVVKSQANIGAKTVTAYFTSFSPVVIVAKLAATPAANATGAAVSPKTGVTSTWGVWAVAGLAFAGAACVVARRKRA